MNLKASLIPLYLNCFGGRGSGGLGMIFSMFSLWKCSFLDAMIAKMWQHLLPLCGQYWQPGACTKIPRLHSDTNQPNKAPLAPPGHWAGGETWRCTEEHAKVSCYEPRGKRKGKGKDQVTSMVLNPLLTTLLACLDVNKHMTYPALAG